MAVTRALVLGGGGVAGIAWEVGVLAGLAEQGVDVSGADFLLGTSAGAAVAGQLGSGLALEELFRRQVEPALQNVELAPTGTSVSELMIRLTELAATIPDPVELARQIGILALSADTVTEPERRAVIAGRLPVHEWAQRRIAVVAVDAHTGVPRVFDRESGVGLVDAVAASCAVPGIWPPTTIDGARYLDGGVRSNTNVDLAAGYQRVLIVAPMVDPMLDAGLRKLPEQTRVQLIAPDEASATSFGVNPLDPAVRTPAARAGFAQGRQAAATVREFWLGE
ncbi:NTE family protein [Kitasatospora sp. MAP12-15]|uniref:patatin-like phospholipase family protein n=1 Tax=unclassified Kitasatospora TaxID=2633591 RepID=UPI002473A4CE|nr:patatin-like phospholipase family protein [Kitasatospora sp. MAP12-44]MDH6114175.1 NTE family protein [Kitasatospora sp. MAP12-44]